MGCECAIWVVVSAFVKVLCAYAMYVSCAVCVFVCFALYVIYLLGGEMRRKGEGERNLLKWLLFLAVLFGMILGFVVDHFLI